MIESEIRNGLLGDERGLARWRGIWGLDQGRPDIKTANMTNLVPAPLMLFEELRCVLHFVPKSIQHLTNEDKSSMSIMPPAWYVNTVGNCCDWINKRGGCCS